MQHRLLPSVCTLALACLFGFASADGSVPAAAGRSGVAAALPSRLWAVELSPALARASTGPVLGALRGAGVNAVVAGSGVHGALLAALRRSAAAHDLLALVPVRSASTCASSRNAAPCVVRVASLDSALTLAARRPDALFVVPLPSLARLGGAAPTAGRVLAVVPVSGSTSASAWVAKLAAGGADPRLQVAAAPTTPRALTRYLSIVKAARRSGGGPNDGAGNTANLWVDGNGGSCRRSPTAAAYQDGGACRSVDQAYDAAACADIVRVKGGTYGAQTVTGQRSCGGAWDGVSCALCVQVLPAQNETVTLTGDLTASADWVEFVGFNMPNDSWKVTGANIDHVICRSCNESGLFYIGAGPMTNISVIGGSVGPMHDVHPQIDGTGLSDALFKGVRFHDVTCGDCAAYHVECLQLNGGTRVTFDGNLWQNCGIFDLSLTQYNGAGPPTDILVQNNFFGAPVDGGAYSFHVNSNARQIVRLTLQYNSSSAPFLLANVVPLQDAIVRGNAAPAPSCNPPGSVRFERNVWLRKRCDGTDLSVTNLGFVNPAAADFHLVAGAAAIGRGAATCPATDYDGQRRPQPVGSACDAGADER